MDVDVSGANCSCNILNNEANCIDLGYSLSNQTIFWPSDESGGFSLCLSCTPDAKSPINPNDTYFYSAGTFSCAEHGGTHVDAPFHFAADGATVDLLPLNHLIAPCRVIDIESLCSVESGKDYTLSVRDIEEHEITYGTITSGSIVLVRTGWSQYYHQGSAAYLGFDKTVHGNYDLATSILSFPGLSPEVCELFVSRKVAAVGLDTGNNKLWINLKYFTYSLKNNNLFLYRLLSLQHL
jgi:kynurenine formamidase